MKGEMKMIGKGIDEWDGERDVSLLRLENSPDVRESRWLLFNDD